MPEVLVSIAHEGLAVMTIYFGLFLWYFDEAVLPKLPLRAVLAGPASFDQKSSNLMKTQTIW